MSSSIFEGIVCSSPFSPPAPTFGPPRRPIMAEACQVMIGVPVPDRKTPATDIASVGEESNYILPVIALRLGTSSSPFDSTNTDYVNVATIKDGALVKNEIKPKSAFHKQDKNPLQIIELDGTTYIIELLQQISVTPQNDETFAIAQHVKGKWSGIPMIIEANKMPRVSNRAFVVEESSGRKYIVDPSYPGLDGDEQRELVNSLVKDENEDAQGGKVEIEERDIKQENEAQDTTQHNEDKPFHSPSHRPHLHHSPKFHTLPALPSTIHRYPSFSHPYIASNMKELEESYQKIIDLQVKIKALESQLAAVRLGTPIHPTTSPSHISPLANTASQATESNLSYGEKMRSYHSSLTDLHSAQIQTGNLATPPVNVWDSPAEEDDNDIASRFLEIDMMTGAAQERQEENALFNLSTVSPA